MKTTTTKEKQGEKRSFSLRIQTADGHILTRSVSYPDGTSPREVAAHQFARFRDYAWITVTRDYANPFGRVPYSFSPVNC